MDNSHDSDNANLERLRDLMFRAIGVLDIELGSKLSDNSLFAQQVRDCVETYLSYYYPEDAGVQNES